MSNTREQIILLADEFIRTRGFNAFSYADIAQQLQIRNAAIHYHFPAKADLGMAVLAYEMLHMREAWKQWATLPEDVQLQKFTQSFGIKSEKNQICLMGSLSPDFITFTPAMQEKVQEMATDITVWVTDVLKRGREKGLLAYKGEPYDRALLAITSMQSSLLLARVLGPQAFETIRQQLLQDLRP